MKYKLFRTSVLLLFVLLPVLSSQAEIKLCGEVWTNGDCAQESASQTMSETQFSDAQYDQFQEQKRQEYQKKIAGFIFEQSDMASTEQVIKIAEAAGKICEETTYSYSDCRTAYYRAKRLIKSQKRIVEAQPNKTVTGRRSERLVEEPVNIVVNETRLVEFPLVSIGRAGQQRLQHSGTTHPGQPPLKQKVVPTGKIIPGGGNRNSFITYSARGSKITKSSQSSASAFSPPKAGFKPAHSLKGAITSNR